MYCKLIKRIFTLSKVLCFSLNYEGRCMFPPLPKRKGWWKSSFFWDFTIISQASAEIAECQKLELDMSQKKLFQLSFLPSFVI